MMKMKSVLNKLLLIASVLCATNGCSDVPSAVGQNREGKMKRLIIILVVVPIMMMLSQCIFIPFTTGYVDGVIFDANDGYLVPGVYVEVMRYARCGDCPRTHSHSGARIAHAVTDYEGYFACEFAVQSGYYYELVLSKMNYHTASMSLGSEPDHYVEIDLVPVWHWSPDAGDTR
jgi:hypothetical protein